MNEPLSTPAVFRAPDFCPACWERIAETDAICPTCGTDVARYLAENDYGAQLIVALTSGDARRRLMAASILGERQESRAVPTLRKIMLDERHDPHLARVAVEALIKIGGPEAIEVLRIIRNHHPIRQVRLAAAVALLPRASTR